MKRKNVSVVFPDGSVKYYTNWYRWLLRRDFGVFRNRDYVTLCIIEGYKNVTIVTLWFKDGTTAMYEFASYDIAVERHTKYGMEIVGNYYNFHNNLAIQKSHAACLDLN